MDDRITPGLDPGAGHDVVGPAVTLEKDPA